MKSLFKTNGKFYKVNLHCHTKVSDGGLTPDEMKELYKKNGYSAVAFTDHNLFITHNDLTDDEFVALNGYETCFTEPHWVGVVDKPGFCDVKSTHLCIIAMTPDEDRQPLYCPDFITRASGNIPDFAHLAKYFEGDEPFVKEHTPESINKAIRLSRDRGFFVTYNHPNWTMDTYEDYGNYEGMNALEIYNNVSAQYGVDDYCPKVYDELLRQGKRLVCVATDDNHNSNRTPVPDSFGGFTMIRAEKLDYVALMNALERGDCYASCGPLFEDISYEGGKIFVKTSTPVKRIDFSTSRRHQKAVFDRDGKGIFEGEFEPDERDEYVRVTLLDFEGNHANSRAYFKDEFK